MDIDNDTLTDCDYPWLLSLDEAMILCIEHLEMARQAQRGLLLGLHLKMASRALRHALGVYEQRLERKNDGKEHVCDERQSEG